MPLMDIENLDFSYEEKDVLHDICLSTESNSIVSILGPNGVGKTTLLKCICNIHRPTRGMIMVGGEDIQRMTSRELARKVAYVPQKTFATKTTVFDTVLIGRRPHVDWMVTEKDMEIAWDVMESLGLGDIALKYVDEISGGEFQKVQIARALAQEPSLLILDEPSNNLDIANQHIALSVIEDVVRKRGLCTIMTMHDINLAAYYSDIFVFMKAGRIVACGGHEVITPETIHEVYGIESDVVDYDGMPVVIPRRRHRNERASVRWPGPRLQQAPQILGRLLRLLLRVPAGGYPYQDSQHAIRCGNAHLLRSCA